MATGYEDLLAKYKGLKDTPKKSRSHLEEKSPLILMVPGVKRWYPTKPGFRHIKVYWPTELPEADPTGLYTFHNHDFGAPCHRRYFCHENGFNAEDYFKSNPNLLLLFNQIWDPLYGKDNLNDSIDLSFG